MRLVIVSLTSLGALFALQQAPAPCLDKPAADRPYTHARLIAVVSDQPARRAEYLIRTCGVRVPFTKELEVDLKEAGAEPGLIQAVREVSGKTETTKVAEAPKPPPSPKPGQVATNPTDGLRYVYVPPGRFRMGCSDEDKDCEDDEKPAHDVHITKGFWMGQTEVTVEAYKRYVRAAEKKMPSDPKFGDNNHNPGWSNDGVPMTMVTWSDSRSYCEWAGLRLPTDAEWEYAARAGTKGVRYGTAAEVAWYGDNSGNQHLDTSSIWRDEGQKSYGKKILDNGNRPHAVAQKLPNPFKLYDMLGNVQEWTADWYKDTYYNESPEEDPQGPPGGEMRMLRGGSWDVQPKLVRASFRNWNLPAARYYFIGFRCVWAQQAP